jgi:hypothetical protein
LADGSITDIGHECGQNKFPENWSEFEQKYKVGRSDYDMRLRFNEVKKQGPKYLKRTLELQSRNPSPAMLDIRVHNELCNFTSQVQKNLKKRAQTKNYNVSKSVRLSTEDSIELAESSGADTKYETIRLMTIGGLGAVIKHNQLNTISEFHRKIEQLSQIDGQTLSYSELKNWNNFIVKLDEKISVYSAIYEDCTRFLNPMNIAEIKKNWRYI